MTLAFFLQKQGYERVPLSRSGVGHFHAAGALNDTPVGVLVDTGAASSVVSLAFVNRAGLRCEPLANKGGGAGGAALDIFHLPDVRLVLAHIDLEIPALYAMDLHHVNEALRQRNQQPVEVILGADVLEPQAAIIDYASSSLFLKTSPCQPARLRRPLPS